MEPKRNELAASGSTLASAYNNQPEHEPVFDAYNRAIRPRPLLMTANQAVLAEVT